MSARIAIELTPSHLRAVIASGWRDAPGRTLDVAWSPEAPEAGVTALRAAAGAADAIALSIGLGLLHVTRVELPAAPEEARERMLSLESERFFATTAPAIVALAPGGAVAFAVDAGALQAWCDAFERWAPIVRIDATPTALARALGPNGGGDYQLDAGSDTFGFVSIRAGAVVAARRIPLSLGERPGVTLPTVSGVPGSHLAAWGALLGEDAVETGTLASTGQRVAFASRRRRRLAVAVLAAVAGLALAASAADRWRERTLAALSAEVAARRDAAAPGREALAARAALDAEVAALRRIGASRVGSLAALAAISSALPPDAVVLNARAVGREWQVDGTAASAATLVPRLDADGHFENVRILSASSRFRDGSRTRETFSIALRVRPGA